MKKTQYFQMEFKNVEIKAEDNKIIIEGFASTPDLDSYDDIVKPSAFLDTMTSYMQKPLILLQHNLDKIIGKATDYRIEENGLWLRVELFNDLDGCFKSIQEGLLGQFSIGFMAQKWEIREEGDRLIREITKIKLVEVSVVTFPANPNAKFNLVKSLKSFFDGLMDFDLGKIGAYQVKSENNDEELKADDIEIEEQTPPTVEANQEETKANVIETSGETPSNDTAVKSEEVKALELEKETLENEIKKLKETLEQKDEELKNVGVEKIELENKYNELDLQVKEYLSNGVLETKNEKKLTQYYASYFNI